VSGDLALDVQTASDGRFSSDPADVFARWAEFADWATSVEVGSHPASIAFTVEQLGAPSPRPRQVIGVGLNYVVPEEAFIWVTSISLVGSLWTWGIIMIAHLGYRRAVARGEAAPVAFRMPGAPVANWLVVAFLVLVAVFLGFDPSTRVALYVAPVWFALLIAGFLLTGGRSRPALGLS